ncbi:hypothetical protein Trco_005563 [Trichoderma cornu-damae]|uniref:Uncharacterized protein n=1 Tax=Trichoderma cornu-damae TaxID=654480 RepID=A0A9P8QHI5_9HYPO|nr:hypothetical protein Trco_005563 [Trichoderma cornu-damae]
MDTSSSSATAAAASALGSSQNRINVPKDTSHQASLNSPPPAYTPRMASDPEQLLRQQMRGPFTVGRPPMAEAVLETMASENEDDEYQEEGTSAIWLRINTSVLISKNNNLVCLPDTPASHANAIAKAVVQAIQENSSGQCGIPMIDEDGRPRPVKIEVDAGITVEGSGNVVGSEDVVNQVLRQRGLARHVI